MTKRTINVFEYEEDIIINIINRKVEGFKVIDEIDIIRLSKEEAKDLLNSLKKILKEDD